MASLAVVETRASALLNEAAGEFKLIFSMLADLPMPCFLAAWMTGVIHFCCYLLMVGKLCLDRARLRNRRYLFSSWAAAIFFFDFRCN